MHTRFKKMNENHNSKECMLVGNQLFTVFYGLVQNFNCF